MAHPRCWAPVVCCGRKHWQYLQNPLPAVNYNVLRERSSSSLPSKGAARGPRVSHKELPSGARQTCTFFWQVTRALTFHEEPFQSGDQLLRHRAPRAGAGRFTPRWWVGRASRTGSWGEWVRGLEAPLQLPTGATRGRRAPQPPKMNLPGASEELGPSLWGVRGAYVPGRWKEGEWGERRRRLRGD